MEVFTGVVFACVYPIVLAPFVAMETPIFCRIVFALLSKIIFKHKDIKYI